MDSDLFGDGKHASDRWAQESDLIRDGLEAAARAFACLEQVRGIEPPISTLEKGRVLTLNYTRKR